MDVFFAREKIKKKKKFLNITVINAPNSFSSMKRKINSWACTKNPYDTEYQFFRKTIFRNSRMENIYQNRNNISKCTQLFKHQQLSDFRSQMQI